jgi:ATP-dependent DNA ligase
VEIAFDHITGNRIRHGARFLRWRDDKEPRECLIEQLRS